MSLLTIVAFLVVLGVMVLAHEFGHFIVARKAGVKVEEFGLGIPPRLIGCYKDDSGRWRVVGHKQIVTTRTIWSLNLIPLGGFVKIKGEQGEAATDSDSFAAKGIGVRVAILTAGVAMNIFLAIVLLAVIFTVGVPQAIDNQALLPSAAHVTNPRIEIVEILAKSPAQAAGLKAGDVLITIDDKIFSSISEIQNYLNQQIGQPIDVAIKRDDQKIITELIPEILSTTDRGGIGVGLANVATVSYPWYLAGWHGVKETFNLMIGVIVGFYTLLKDLLLHQQFAGDVYGPVGIASLVGSAAKMGLIYLVQFTAVLSVIIAVINYLPFPALDGGRVLFLIIEAVRGKPINQRIEALMHNLGFALLMLLVLVVTFRDVLRIAGGVSGLWAQLARLF